MTTPRSIRFEEDTVTRLAAFVSRRPGVTSASAAARFVEEGLRMDAHPSVYFRDGAAGRRAVLVGGPDVWEVVKAVKEARDANAKLKGTKLRDLVCQNTGLTSRSVEAALAYYGDFPQEIDIRIAQESVLERELMQSLRHRDELLGA